MVKEPTMTKPDLSTESLLARKELAEKATPGDWKVYDVAYQVYGIENQDGADVSTATLGPHGDEEDFAGILDESDAAHIAANSPGVVIATINELVRLRAESARFDWEAEWLADKLKQYKGPSITYKGEIMSLREAARMAVEEVCPLKSAEK